MKRKQAYRQLSNRKMMTYADLFSGFGGSTIGALQAGVKPIWAIEKRHAIANVANLNLGEHTIVADILNIDPNLLDSPDVLHASPPCPNFSNAKQGGEESEHDIDMARKVAEFIAVLSPRVLTLENVYQYRKSASWAVIRDTLNRCGYWFDLAHVNAADYGVPQTRKRMIVRAVLGDWVPYLPPPEPWVGWYEAIGDLIDGLPESEFAPWQLRGLPRSLRCSAMFSNQNSYDHEGNIYGTVYREEGESAFTIRDQHVLFRAFIVDGNNVRPKRVTVRSDAEPTMTVTAQRQSPKAFIISGQYGQAQNESGKSRRPQVRDGQTPSFTVTASNRGWRAWLNEGRVVSLTPRCLARFQTFPDWYELPEKKSLACYGIGNAVPPLLYQKLLEGLLK
jgi:DNA (cytosine-5)-methyltransferase 1